MKYDFYMYIFISLYLLLMHEFQKLLSESFNLKISSVLAILFSVTLKATKIAKAFSHGYDR